jgi:choline-sulfatase
MLMALPGIIPAGVVDGNLLSHYDIMPTLLDYLGFTHQDADLLPGQSFASLLKGETKGVRENVVVFDEYGPVRMIRNHEWKYVHRYPYGPHELYDLVNDAGEEVNLINAPAYQQRVVEMKAQLEAWFVRYVNPNLDGTKEPVAGKGQIDLAGIAGQGREAHKQDWWYIDEDGNRLENQVFHAGGIWEKGIESV